MTPIKKQEQSEGQWQVIGKKSQAKVFRSYMINGERRTKSEWPVGTPAQVKVACAPQYQGEVTQLEWVRTDTDLERIQHQNTVNGITKEHDIRTIQTHDFGDGKSVPTSANPNGAVYDTPADEAVLKGAMDKTDYLKNMQDEHQADNRNTEAQNRADHRTLYVVAGCALAVGLVACLIAVVA